MLPRSHPLTAAGAAIALFAEDFDDPPGVTVLDDEPDAPPRDDEAAAPADAEPPALDLDAEREAAFTRGRQSALDELAATARLQRQEQTRLLGEIAALLRDSEAAARAMAERSAEAIARLLLTTLASVLPSACARHGADEVVAIARTVLPALRYAPEVTIRAHASALPALADLLGTLDPLLRPRIHLTEADGVAAGDIRIDWPDGGATRDAATLWRGVAAALAPLGLLDPPPLNP